MIRSVRAGAGILLVFAAPLLAQQGRDESTFTWSKKLAAGAQVTIRNLNGPITVREATDDRVDVRATKVVSAGGSVRDVAFDVNETGGNVEICSIYDQQASCDDRNTGRNRSNHVRVEYTVVVPRSMRLTLSTGNGELSIARTGADVTASTGNGRVTIGQTSGRVDVSSGNGDIRVDGADGPVRVTTGNGRIVVTTAQGDVNASTGNGEIDVRISALTATRDMTFNSGSGAIRVSLPGDFNGQIDASTGSGSLRSDFAISVVGRINAQHVRGTIGTGTGGPLLRLNTGNGMIELRKD